MWFVVYFVSKKVWLDLDETVNRMVPRKGSNYPVVYSESEPYNLSVIPTHPIALAQLSLSNRGSRGTSWRALCRRGL